MSLKPDILRRNFPHLVNPLPLDLGNGLVLRAATLEDAENLAQFEGRVFGRDHFDEQTAAWVRDLCSDKHPACGPSNITIVEDTNAGGRIASSMCLIPQTWTFSGIPIDVGRMEAVVTDPDYRRRGLVRAQFDVHHARSASMGHLLQAITGIPWYYRQFGYEYAIDLGGGRMTPFSSIPTLKDGETEPYHLRPLEAADLPFVMPLYDRDAARSLVACPRPEWLWQHYAFKMSSRSFENRPFQIIETIEGKAVGYVAPSREMGHDLYAINELSVAEGSSLRSVMPSMLRQLRLLAEAQAAEQSKTVSSLYFQLGREHPLFSAIPEYLPRTRPPYGWYVRVPSKPALVQRIAPVLEARLARSTMAGYTGELKINEYQTIFRMVFEQGRLAEVTDEPATDLTEWSPAFPPGIFLQLLFGYRSLSELMAAFADCYVRGESAVLVDALFPKQASYIVPVS